MARRGLGKGLDALIPGDFLPVSSTKEQIAIIDIAPNPSQPRGEISDDGLEELAQSILEHGVLQPLILSKSESEKQYTLIAGERRLRAAEMAGLESVPAIVREVTEQERLEIALIENIQREDLKPLEAALAYQKLNDEFNLSHNEISKRVGKSRTSITNTLRLLKLPDDVQIALHTGKITEGHARSLLGLSSKKSQSALLQTILKKQLNVRQAEELVRKLSGQTSKTSTVKKSASPEVRSMEDQLRTSLGTKVTLKHGKKGGTITIHYYSNEELDELINRFKRL